MHKQIVVHRVAHEVIQLMINPFQNINHVVTCSVI